MDFIQKFIEGNVFVREAPYFAARTPWTRLSLAWYYSLCSWSVCCCCVSQVNVQ